MQTRPSNRKLIAGILSVYSIATSIALVAMYLYQPERLSEALPTFIGGLSILCLLAWLKTDFEYRKEYDLQEQRIGHLSSDLSATEQQLRDTNKAHADLFRELKSERYRLAREKERLEQELKRHMEDLESIKEEYSEVVRKLKSAHDQLKARGEMMARRDKDLRNLWIRYGTQKRAADYWRKKYHNPKTRYHGKHQGQDQG